MPATTRCEHKAGLGKVGQAKMGQAPLVFIPRLYPPRELGTESRKACLPAARWHEVHAVRPSGFGRRLKRVTSVVEAAGNWLAVLHTEPDSDRTAT